MRTRSQAAAKAYCGVCHEEQFATGGGYSCKNGHGGAPSHSHAEALAAEEDRRLADEAKKRIVNASAALAEEVAKNDAPMPGRFLHARSRGVDPLNAKVARIVESVFIDDPDAVYTRLEAGLRVGERRTDYSTLMRALDDAEGNARDAHRLMITAKLEAERWELENRSIYAAMREQARDALQAEKDKKQRSKAITDADVEDMAAIMFPDEYAAQQVKLRRVNLTVKSMEDLVSKWDSRCRSLQTMLSKLR